MIRAKTHPPRAIIAGTIAAAPYHGGAAWAVLQYVLGLRELGWDVYFVEPISPSSIEPSSTPLELSSNAQYFRQLVNQFGLERNAALLLESSSTTIGLSYAELRSVAASAHVLLNISGMLQDELASRIPVRAYLDLDPTFVQLWNTQGTDMRFADHTHFVTIGLNIGEPGCEVPTCNKDWIATLQPVVLSQWPVCEQSVEPRLTTVGNWRSYGSITHDGVFYGQKAHSIREIISLPMESAVPVRLAMALDPQERRDIQQLAEHGWELVDPALAAATPDLYQNFIAGSWAELGVAKAGYVKSACGWFSDRSICYLASGRPVIAQDTNFKKHLPTGQGLLSFSSSDDALAAIESLGSNYKAHARQARQIAEEYFDSRVVLRRLLDRLGCSL